MSFENDPQRPEGAGAFAGQGAPRIEVEPTPVEPVEGSTQAGQTSWYEAQSQRDAAPYATTGAAGAGASVPPTTPPDFNQPNNDGNAPLSTRTVVKTKTKKLPVFLASLGGLVVGAVLVIALVMTGAFRITDKDVEAPIAQQQTIDIDPEDTTLAEVVSAKCLPSVVSIATQTQEGGGIGSGVIIDADGNILTNYHVVEGAQAIEVTLDDGTSYEGEIVGTDESSDLAVVHLVDAEDATITPIEQGDSDALTVGEWVMAIGSPFGNEQSVSTGIVSALYRSTALPSSTGTSIYANMIQTDAAINPGNSGGALVNDQGQLIGINSIIESASGSSSGVGFAIPVNYAINIANQIIAGETPAHPYLGVTVTSVNAFTARQENLGVTEGALVTAVNEGTPAADAGLQVDDIVTKVNDDEVTSADSLIITLREYAVGDTVTLTVMRGGKEQQVEVTLGSDAELQTDQQDTSTGDGAGNSMTEEEFLQYLQELLGGGYSGRFGQNG